MRTAALTLVTLIAFAANSVLNRMALTWELIDPASFTQIRLLSAALVLAPFTYALRRHIWPLRTKDAWPALALAAYALAFSLAYLSLDAGMGALILFAAVQITMIGWALISGDRLGALQWLGLAGALGGLVWLVSPGLSAPDSIGAALMALSGLAWGLYSLFGRSEADPVAATARNFLLATPLALLLSLSPTITGEPVYLSPAGVGLALGSGIAASGFGYVIWYMALRNLSATTASVVQLTVPLIAALGGVLLLSEPMSWRLATASALILGGIFLVVRFKRPV